MNNEKQMSEAFLNAVFLTLSGGFQDAYTYISRHNVFANAQTGNIVLMSTYVLKGEWHAVLRYLIPVLMFISGIFFTELFRSYLKNIKVIHWRQIILIVEILLLFTVGFIPHDFDIAANSIVSFVCAMQVQTFRKIEGYTYASTMCIGNMRSAAESLCGYLLKKNKTVLNKTIKYFAVILIFAIGAGTGGVLTDILGIKSIWISCALLLFSFCVMMRK